jgi:hypothetical protein
MKTNQSTRAENALFVVVETHGNDDGWSRVIRRKLESAIVESSRASLELHRIRLIMAQSFRKKGGKSTLDNRPCKRIDTLFVCLPSFGIVECTSGILLTENRYGAHGAHHLAEKRPFE